MIGDVNFNDLIRIYQIRTKPRPVKPVERNKNFEEFSDVYKEVFSSSVPEPSGLKVSYGGTNCKYIERYPTRPLHDVKKIRMEMPLLGAERAIVTPPKLPVEKKQKKKPETTDKSLLTESEITKYVKKTVSGPLTKEQKECGSLTDTQLYFQQTKKELEESDAQFRAIKSFIDQIKPPEKVRKSRIPTYKAKKKPDRHAECVSKKYMSTLNTMQQKLQKLEEKYFGKPRVIYKNVRDICTTFSNIDLLYKDHSSTGNVDIQETLTGIKQELEEMANTVPAAKEEKKPKVKTVTFKAPEVEFNTVGDTFDEDKNITPMNFSFKKPSRFDEDDEELIEQEVNYVKLIDRSESFFKEYQHLTKDVEDIYDEINSSGDELREEYDESKHEEEVKSEKSEEKSEEESKSITEGSESETHDSDIDKFYNEDGPGVFSKEMKDVISSSSYLTKEFAKTQPTVKVFTNSDRYVHNRYLGIPSNTSTSLDPSIMNLIDNLSLSLKDSIYYKPE